MRTLLQFKTLQGSLSFLLGCRCDSGSSPFSDFQPEGLCISWMGPLPLRLCPFIFSAQNRLLLFLTPPAHPLESGSLPGKRGLAPPAAERPSRCGPASQSSRGRAPPPPGQVGNRGGPGGLPRVPGAPHRAGRPADPAAPAAARTEGRGPDQGSLSSKLCPPLPTRRLPAPRVPQGPFGAPLPQGGSGGDAQMRKGWFIGVQASCWGLCWWVAHLHAAMMVSLSTREARAGLSADGSGLQGDVCVAAVEPEASVRLE